MTAFEPPPEILEIQQKKAASSRRDSVLSLVLLTVSIITSSLIYLSIGIAVLY